MIYLIAIDQREAMEYARDHRLRQSEVRYLVPFDYYALNGTQNPDVRFIGRWRQRRDAEAIERFVASGMRER